MKANPLVSEAARLMGAARTPAKREASRQNIAKARAKRLELLAQRKKEDSHE